MNSLQIVSGRRVALISTVIGLSAGLLPSIRSSERYSDMQPERKVAPLVERPRMLSATKPSEKNLLPPQYSIGAKADIQREGKVATFKEKLQKVPATKPAEKTSALQALPQVPSVSPKSETISPKENGETQTLAVKERVRIIEESLKKVPVNQPDSLDKMTAIQQEIQKLLDERKTLFDQNEELTTKVNDLSTKLTELANAERERLKPIELEVTFELLDVYGDGSWGGDCWSVAGTVNGMNLPIWNHKENITDDHTRGNGPGPRGDADCTRYPLGQKIKVIVPANGELTVKFYGTAHDNNVPVQQSSMTFSAASNWGTKGMGHFLGNETLNRMEGDGDTSYHVFFNVTKLN